ncbi:MAG: chromate transporter [Candidatus Brocadiia bacterium]
MSSEEQDPSSSDGETVRVPKLTLFYTFFRIGLLTFGGGFAMAAVLRHEIVLRRHWMSEKEFINTLSIATAVPGSIAVNLAFLEGRRLGGVSGAVVSTVATMLPSVLVILLITRFLAPYFDHPVLGAFLQGCAVAVTAQIAFAAYTFARHLRRHWQNAVVCAAGLLVVALGWHPVLAILLAGLLGYMMMKERMALRDGEDGPDGAFEGPEANE